MVVERTKLMMEIEAAEHRAMNAGRN